MTLRFRIHFMRNPYWRWRMPLTSHRVRERLEAQRGHCNYRKLTGRKK